MQTTTKNTGISRKVLLGHMLQSLNQDFCDKQRGFRIWLIEKYWLGSYIVYMELCCINSNLPVPTGVIYISRNCVAVVDPRNITGVKMEYCTEKDNLIGISLALITAYVPSGCGY